MKLNYKYLLLQLLLLAQLNNLQAENLVEIYGLALANDPILNTAISRNLANQEIETQVKSVLMPTFTLNASLFNLESLDPNRPTNYATGELDPNIVLTETTTESSGWSVVANQTLLDWSRIYQLRQAEKIVALGDLRLSMSYQDIILRVVDAYFSLISATKNLEFFESRLKRVSEQFDQATRRFELGVIPVTDLQAIQSQRDLAISSIITSQRQLIMNEDRLAEIIGTRLDRLNSLKDDFNFTLPEPNDINYWLERGLSSSLELNGSLLESDIAYDSLRAVKASRLPVLRFSATLSNNATTVTRTNELMNNPPCLGNPPCPSLYADSLSHTEDIRYSLNFSLPLFSGGLISSRIRESSYNYDATNHEVTRQQRVIERSIRDAFLGVQLGVSQINAYKQAILSAELNLNATERAYTLGSRTPSDILIAEENLVNAQVNLENAKKDYLISGFRLKALVGALNAQDLIELNDALTTI